VQGQKVAAAVAGETVPTSAGFGNAETWVFVMPGMTWEVAPHNPTAPLSMTLNTHPSVVTGDVETILDELRIRKGRWPRVRPRRRGRMVAKSLASFKFGDSFLQVIVGKGDAFGKDTTIIFVGCRSQVGRQFG